MPWTGGAMVVFLTRSSASRPRRASAGKLLLFGAAVEADYVWLAGVGIANSGPSLAAYLRVVVPMYGTPKAIENS